MKNVYAKPTLEVMSVVQSEDIAATPWENFTNDMTGFSGSISSYSFSSGNVLGGSL